jgi:sarcosine oxidase subunit beta
MTRSDVIVIGAGIVGASCALRLAERGLAVTVVEREAAPATGSTARSAAGVRHQFSDPVNVMISRDAIAEYRQMPEAGYQPIGYLFYVPQAQWDAQCEAVRMQRELGADVRLLTPQQAAQIVPASLDGIAGASHCADDGIVDPHGICMAWVAQARALGVRFALGREVIDLSHDGAHWQVSTRGERTGPAGDTAHDARRHEVLEARLLVNAAGAWSGRVAALAGLQVPVGPARRMVFTTGPLDAALRLGHPYPLTVDVATGLWLRSERERLIFGLSNPDDSGFSEGIDWPWLDNTIEAALTRFPWFEQLSLDRRASWWGYYEDTPDHNAILGAMPQAPGWINACGFSGHGVQQAATVGRLIACEALGEPGPIDIGPLRIERFAAGAAAQSASERLIV